MIIEIPDNVTNKLEYAKVEIIKQALDRNMDRTNTAKFIGCSSRVFSNWFKEHPQLLKYRNKKEYLYGQNHWRSYKDKQRGFMEATTEVFGIENLKKIIALVVEAGNVGDKIGQEGSKVWKKWFTVIDLLDECIDLVKCDFKALKSEFSDLSEAEKGEIKEFIKVKFDIHNDKLEYVIEESLLIAMNIEDSVRRAIEMFKNLKTA